MSAPTPLFQPVFTKPLSPRLAEGAVIANARVIDPHRCDPDDPRPVPADDHALRFIALGTVGLLLIEWPDGVLAWAYLPCGPNVLMALRNAMLDAYSRGRDVLERIHTELGLPAGNA